LHQANTTQHFINLALRRRIQDTAAALMVRYSGKKEDCKSQAHLKADQLMFTVPVTSEITADGHAHIHNILTIRTMETTTAIFVQLTLENVFRDAVTL
jgi:Lhr-like helicase